MAENEEQFLSEETGTEFENSEDYEAANQFQETTEYEVEQKDQQYGETEQFEGNEPYGEQQFEDDQQFSEAQEFEENQEMDATEQTSHQEEEQTTENNEGQHFEDHPQEAIEESLEQSTGNASKNGDDERKIFVGGLSWETTSKDLKEYFEKFGKVVDCTLKTDPNTGRSRGFGFVLFDSVASVDKVVEEKSHVLHNKNIDPKRAMVRGGSRIDSCKKVFVGGVSPDMPESEIREYFEKYGKIEEVELPFDRVKNQRRAYVFVSYESEEVVERVIANSKQTLGGKEVDVRKATPRADPEGFGRGGRGGPGQRGRGRGRGGYPGQAAGGYYPDASGTAAVPPAYDYSSYYNYGQGYGTGYAYPGYGYPGYDYSSYYGQTDWSNYQQNYNTQTSSSYPGGYYDYSNWYGQDQNAQSGAGKTKRGASGTSYHPYSR